MISLKPLQRLAALSILLSMVACGGEDESTAKSSTIEPKLQAIEQKVFAQSCTFSSCHGTDSPKQGLSLVAPTHAALVGKASNEVSGRVLVVPFDAEQSYLYEKLTKDQPASGARMPFASEALSGEQLAAIKLWIENGALE
ncbi:MAG TPA: hypothetical protein VKP30_07985 [Polyangiaceae bacterium]|nr:hypothetical protein [Polyangiaceae bacterium]